MQDLQQTTYQAWAYILIGGESDRFGSPKWTAVLAGKTILERLWNLCSQHFQKVFLVGKEQPPGITYPTLVDALDLAAPFSGVYTALQHSAMEWNLILSCDLPLINANIIHTLWRNCSVTADLVVPNSGRGLEPLCALYRKGLLKSCEEMFREEVYSLQELISRSRSRILPLEEEQARFLNVNRPADLKVAEEHLSKKA